VKERKERRGEKRKGKKRKCERSNSTVKNVSVL
jgi:hypothetical protein